MSRRRGQGLSPSLFPFLAVLVCTLGTLILLLAMVAQNATDTAQQQARTEQVAEAEQRAESDRPRLSAEAIESMLAEENFRVQQLVAFRDQQTADLEDRRDQLTHLEDHMSRLREQLKQISDEVDRTLSETRPPAIDQAAIEELRDAIASEQATVQQLRENANSETPRVVIVPHKGPNGTERRPVYLECTVSGVRIWPEGSQIPITQLENASYSANPLDAALRTIRLHAMKHYGDSVPPYPLLIVRPDGIESYAAARQAMRDWDDQFGYELVPADVKLAFNEPDTQLKRRIELAIHEAAAQQQKRLRIASPGGSGGRATRGTFDSRGSGGRLPILSAASMDRAGRASGYGSIRENRSAATGSPYGNRGPQAGGTSMVPQSAYSGGGPYSDGTATYTTDQAASEARKWANEMQSAAEELRASRSGSGWEDGALSPSYSTPRSNPFAPSNPDAQPSLAAPSNSGSQADQDSAATDRSTANLDDGSRSGTGRSTGQLASSQNGSSAGAAPTNGASSPGASSPGASSPGASSASGTPMAAGGPPMQSAATPSPTAPPPMSVAQRPPRGLVRRQGRDWALPDHMAGTSGNEIIRTIRAECYSDRFVLVPPGTGGATEVFGLSEGDVEQATLRLATAIRDRIERWGPALPGGRWQPRLEVLVRPDGEMRFHQLRTLMSGSGVDVVGRTSQ